MLAAVMQCYYSTREGVGIFVFVVSAIFQIGFSVFFSFSFQCSLRIFRFSASGFRFASKILTGFRIWYIRCGLPYLGSGFSSI